MLKQINYSVDQKIFPKEWSNSKVAAIPKPNKNGRVSIILPNYKSLIEQNI